MSKIFLVIFSILIISLVSCSEDNSTNPILSDVSGTWAGQLILGNDTARYSCTISESGGKITGTADLYAFHVSYVNGAKVSETSIRKGTISGTYLNPEIRINFPNDSTDYFAGQIWSDKRSISGTVFTTFEGSNYKGEYTVTLNKK
jgi:hypothetical protein